jgi:hypothetical protein
VAQRRPNGGGLPGLGRKGPLAGLQSHYGLPDKAPGTRFGARFSTRRANTEYNGRAPGGRIGRRAGGDGPGSHVPSCPRAGGVRNDRSSPVWRRARDRARRRRVSGRLFVGR